jgi:N-acylneuraminate cytidylyltransferase
LAAGCEGPFKRPASLARDETPGIDPVLHALDQLPKFDIVVLLQPTSPLRQACDIDGCLERMLEFAAPACISLREAADHPYWTFRCGLDGRLQAFVTPAEGVPSRRQDLPKAFMVNGAVYVARVDWLRQTRNFETPSTVGFEMPEDRSLDIDTEADLASAEAGLTRQARTT